ncbi:MAG: hypothetical protein GY940_32030 [bacterium]|nr:hypothetical protein [bacterium]
MKNRRRFSFLTGIFIVLSIVFFAGHDAGIFKLEASGGGRKKKSTLKATTTNKNFAKLLKLSDDSLLQMKLKYQKPLRKGSLSQLQNREVMLSKSFSQTLAQVSRNVLADQNTFRRNMTRFRGIVTKFNRKVDQVYEFPGSYVVLKSTKVVVSNPAEFARVSPEYKSFIGSQRIREVTAASLGPESRKGFEAFIKNEIPRMSANHPLRKAAKRGKNELLQAIAAGKGTFEIVDTLVIPKKPLPAVGGKLQKPVFKNGSFNHGLAKPLKSARLDVIGRLGIQKQVGVLKDFSGPGDTRYQKHIKKPGITETGSRSFEARFLAGFTKGNSWEWERRWNFPSGFFRVTLGAGYGIGLRIPIKVNGTLYPTLIEVKDTRDRAIAMGTRLKAVPLNAGSGFYRDTGLPQSKVFDGKEAVLEAEFGYGFKLRAVWTTLLHRKYRTYGLNYSKDFTPPSGDCRDCGYRFAIPPRLTHTEFDFKVMKGYAQAALKLSGKGEIQLDYLPIQDGKGKGKRLLSFRDSRYKNIKATLSRIILPPNRVRISQRYGFKLSNPRYKIDLTLTPEIRLGVNIGYKWLSRSFSTGWISLNSFKMKLGTLQFNRHAGTRSEFLLDKGIKRFEKIPGYRGPTGNIVAIQCVRNGKYVKVGNFSTMLEAISGSIGSRERFQIINLEKNKQGNNKIVLRSLWNGKYVRAGVGRETVLGAVSTRISSWETFKKVILPGGKVAFKSVQNNKYVRAGVGRKSRLAATSNRLLSWELFKLWPVADLNRTMKKK